MRCRRCWNSICQQTSGGRSDVNFRPACMLFPSGHRRMATIWRLGAITYAAYSFLVVIGIFYTLVTCFGVRTLNSFSTDWQTVLLLPMFSTLVGVIIEYILIRICCGSFSSMPILRRRGPPQPIRGKRQRCAWDPHKRDGMPAV
jgi:hypothetical protein